MIRLLIIADDFTGALDTGVKFADAGAAVCVTGDINVRLSEISEKATVLVVDVESRHMSEADAYERVYRICLQAKAMKIPYIYKKTDSVLRGNIGSELAAVLDATAQKNIHFVPAFPSMGRTTRDGIHYVNDIPVDKTDFGNDPFDPLETADVAELIERQAKIRTEKVTDLSVRRSDTKSVMIYDAQSDEDIDSLAKQLAEDYSIGLFAGCAGLAGHLAGYLKLSDGTEEKVSLPKDGSFSKLVVVCGSMNPVTLRQLDTAEKNGFIRIRPDARYKLDKSYRESADGHERLEEIVGYVRTGDKVLIDANDISQAHQTEEYARSLQLEPETVRTRIASALGRIAKGILDAGEAPLLFITGGDTVRGFLESVGATGLMPVAEICDGVALSQVEYNRKKYWMVSKSGGFGDAELITKLADRMLDRQ